MNQLRTLGIVLTRVDYGEADRIITVITPDSGKLSMIAKGVRKIQSKLAGGIELFSVSELVYVSGRSNIKTLISSRLKRNFGQIITEVQRTLLGYEVLKDIHKNTEEETDPAHYYLLEQALTALDTTSISLDLIRLWFFAQLLRLEGHTPNLSATPDGAKLSAGEMYRFDTEHTAFVAAREGTFGSNEIKFMRLLFSEHTPESLAGIDGAEKYAAKADPIITLMAHSYLSL